MTTKKQVVDQSILDACVNTLHDLVQQIEKQHQMGQHNPYSARELWPNLFAKADEVLLDLADKATNEELPETFIEAIAEIERLREWRRAIEDNLVICEILSEKHADPRTAINDLIDWHVHVALDPRVSSDARRLVEKGRTESREKLAAWMIENEFSTVHGDTLDNLLDELQFQLEWPNADSHRSHSRYELVRTLTPHQNKGVNEK